MNPGGAAARNWPRRIWRLHTSTACAIVLSLAAILVIVQSVVSACEHLIKPAWHDIWDWVPDYERWLDGHYGWRDLVAPYYEHRIVLTKVLLLLDSAVDAMNGRIEQVVALALLAGLGVLIWRIVRLDSPPGAQAQIPPLFWIAWLSALCQYENIELPFQVQFPIACFFAGLTTLLLATATMHTGRRAIVLAGAAGVAGVVTAFSMGSGVLLAPALFVLLIVRRARIRIWAVFVPISVLGLILFFHGHRPISAPGVSLFDAKLLLVRVIYSCNFLAASIGGFPSVATWAGLAGLVVFGVTCIGLARKFLLRGCTVPAGDAALLALCLMVVLCAPAGTLTGRLALGATAALASRYATMSLLFAAGLFGLAVRWGWRDGVGRAGRAALLGVGLVLLLLVNAPIYFEHAAALQRVVLADAQLIINNVGVVGRTAPIAFGTMDTVRDDITILHARRLNMFDPANGPPGFVLRGMHNVDVSRFPACRGFVDVAYAVDRTGFLVSGWAADAAGQKTADWIAAVDAQGRIIGTARALSSRPDVQAALGMRAQASGFDDGFRLQDGGEPGTPNTVRILGLFPRAETPICALPGAAEIGPLEIVPASQLRDIAKAPSSAAPGLDGVVPADKVAFWHDQAVPGGVAAWAYVAFGATRAHARMMFHLLPVPAGESVAIPFTMANPEAGRSLSVTMADGTVFKTAITTLWHDDSWRAVVVPADVLALHGSAATIEIQAKGETWLAIGAPLTAKTSPEWAKLF